MFRSKHNQLGQDKQTLLFMLWEKEVQGWLDSVQIGDATAWVEETIGWLGPAKKLGHLVQDTLFDQIVERRYFVGEHVRIGCCCHPFAGQWDDVNTLRNLVEVSWMSYLINNFISFTFKLFYKWISSTHRFWLKSPCRFYSHLRFVVRPKVPPGSPDWSYS